MYSTGNDNDRSHQAGNAGQDKILADALEGRAAPREQRANAGKEEKKESNGYCNAVVERRADRDFVSLNIFGEDRKERAPQHREAGREQHKIVEEKTGFAGDQRLELVFSLQVI